MGTFRITSTTTRLDLDAQGRGTLSFTVTNTSGANLRGRASIKTDDGVSPDSFKIAPPNEREFPVDSTEEFAVSFEAPKAAPPGDHKFKLRMVDPRLTDELGNDSDWVGYKIAEQQKKPFPWLWLIIPAAVLIVAAGGGGAWYFVWGPGHHVTTVTPVANVKVARHDSTDFGTIQVHNSSPTSVIQLHNSGTKDANVTASLAGNDTGDFSKAIDTCSGTLLQPNHDCEIHIAFAPQSQGPKSARLTLTVDSGPAVVDIGLTGSAQGVSLVCFNPQPLSPKISYRQGTINPPTAATASLTVTNCGTADLAITNAQLVGDPFSLPRFTIIGNSCNGQTLSPNGGVCYIAVQFNAPVDGQWSVILDVIDNAATSPQQVPVIGVRSNYVCGKFCVIRATF